VSRVIGGRSRSSYLDYEDLVSCGVQGLIEAFHSFDASRGAKFSTYALPRIRGAILDALRAAHPLPRSLQKASADYDRTSNQLYSELGRMPSRPEIAARAGVTLQKLEEGMQAASMRVVSLEQLAETAVSGSIEKLSELADGDPLVDPAAVSEEQTIRRLVAEAVASLPEREREIIRMYYLEEQSLKVIGAAMQISESRASQLRERAVRWMRRSIETELAEAA
jgi:RNA polymerase sigma factor for flagellar operon FliA